MIGWLVVGVTSALNPQPSRRFVRKPTWSAMPSPVMLTEAMRTDSRRVRTRASERSRTAASIMAFPLSERLILRRVDTPSHAPALLDSPDARAHPPAFDARAHRVRRALPWTGGN